MKKSMKICVYALTAALLLFGCSKADDKQTSAAESTAAGETTAGETAAEEEIPEGSVELGEYKGIEAAKVVKAVTDADVDARIESILTANMEYVDSAELGADTAAKNGDIVNRLSEMILRTVFLRKELF